MALPGDFSGEIRLGYTIKNGQKTAISGGSVSGNLLALHGSLLLSKETQRSNRFEGPVQTAPCRGQRRRYPISENALIRAFFRYFGMKPNQERDLCLI